MDNGMRHELKFLISRSAAELLRLRLPHVMRRDPHAGETGQYTIRSLYFDDFCNSAYQEKSSGVADRMKYRIRYYNYDPRFLKLECKEKHGSLTRKRACTITGEQAEQLCTVSPMEGADGLLRELEEKLHREGLRPKVLVDYDRTPFVCADGNTRITLDENLRTRPFCTDLLASPNAMIPVLDPDQVILEVKFDDFLPGYLRDALAVIPKTTMAISKFALCMQYI